MPGLESLMECSSDDGSDGDDDAPERVGGGESGLSHGECRGTMCGAAACRAGGASAGNGDEEEGDDDDDDDGDESMPDRYEFTEIQSRGVIHLHRILWQGGAHQIEPEPEPRPCSNRAGD